MKSGTTICGIQLKDVVILAADTRSTCGPMVADKSLAFSAKCRNCCCSAAQTQALLHWVAYGWPIQLRNCEKLHFIAKNVYCAGAGTAADLQQLAVQMSQNYPPQTRE